MHLEPDPTSETAAYAAVLPTEPATPERIPEVVQLRRILSVTANLSRAVTPDDAAEVMLTEGLAAFGADSGVICVLTSNRNALRVVKQVGLTPHVAETFATFPVDAPLPLCDAIRTGRPNFFESREDVTARYPALHEENMKGMCSAWLMAPLKADGRLLGGFSFGFTQPRSFTDDDRDFVETVALHCARALDRAQVYHREHVLRERAEAARAEAEAANRVKSDFLATMSHELRTPLNAIGGYAELLELGLHGPLTPEQQDHIARIRRSQRHLLSLIEDLLNFTRLEAGQLPFNIDDLPLHEPLDEIESLITPQLQAKELTYHLAPPDTSLRVRADRDKLKQIVVNLLTNAIKFTPDRGRIEVKTAFTDDRVLVQVCDSGCGIPKDKLGAIFDPFVQLDSSLTRTTQGSGLGLSISRNLARGMDGDLSVESTVGSGSVFTLGLPRATMLER